MWTNFYNMYDIAIILINYNSSFHTINCIESIFEKTSKNISFQIIITDNCSEKEDYLLLKNYLDKVNHPDIILKRSPINTGFGAGNMNGYLISKAKYVAFINNDTILLNDCLAIFKNQLDNNPEIGIVGGQAYKQNGDFMVSLDHFASPTREILGRSFLEFINKKKHPKRKKKYQNPIQVNFIPGSFMFLRCEDFDFIGGFDHHIFLYYEETDLCLRLLKTGKTAYLVPEGEFIHLHGASTQKSLAIKKELKLSLLYIIRKHYGYWSHKLVLFYLVINYFFSSIFKPKNWSLFMLLISGAPLSKSLRNLQKIQFYHE
mgnify:FL=1